MRFTPLTPDRLVADLAKWIDASGQGHIRVGIDGASEVGASSLADAVAMELRAVGRPVIRASTSWWWRPASLRLELGRTDVGMLLCGWVDSAALRRELLDPLAPGSSGAYLQRLRDPTTDRSVRETRLVADPNTVLLLDGPFLLAAELPIDHVVHLQVATSTLHRLLPAERQWWLEAFVRYDAQYRPADQSSVVVAYDHPRAPAVQWCVWSLIATCANRSACNCKHPE